MGGGWWRALVVGVLGVTMISGCATTIGGKATSARNAVESDRPGESSAPARPATASAAEMLGAFSTIDPCSLTDPGEFAAYGTATLGVLDSLDDCFVEIRTSAAAPVRVYVGHLDRAEAFPDIRGKQSTELPGGLTVVDYQSEPTYCSQLLLFSDGITLMVSASPDEGSQPELCEMVRAGMDKAVTVIRDGGVKHRTFAANSLALMDPCELVPATAVAAVPGLGAVDPKTYPAKHHCLWAGTDPVAGPRLRVVFAAGMPPRATASGATESPIAGRASVISPSPNTSPNGSNVWCFVEAAHISMGSVVEKAFVSVRLPRGQVDAACKAATDVAGAVWPKLPAP